MPRERSFVRVECSVELVANSLERLSYWVADVPVLSCARGECFLAATETAFLTALSEVPLPKQTIFARAGIIVTDHFSRTTSNLQR